MIELCDKRCNECPLILHKNSRMISFVLNSLVESMGIDKVYPIVQNACPNLTCCSDCAIDDFTHFDGCEIQQHIQNRLAG